MSPVSVLFALQIFLGIAKVSSCADTVSTIGGIGAWVNHSNSLSRKTDRSHAVVQPVA